MGDQHDIPESMAWGIIGRLEAGQTQQAVHHACHVAQSVISRLWNRFLETGDIRRRRGQGRPPSTSAQDRRHLLLLARRNRTMSATHLRAELAAATGTLVSTQTIRNCLHRGGLFARRPMVCIPLTAQHKRDRTTWAQQHQNWTLDDWSRVLFSDESRFCLQPDNRRILIWREPGSRNIPRNVREQPQYEGGSLMVWAGISLGGRTDLHFIRGGGLTGQRYLDEILQPTVLPYAGAVGPGFVFMDDNARPHRANIVNNWFDNHGIERMVWPACSPDCNPIEHAWDALGRRVAARQVPPRGLQQLEVALREEWTRIPQELLDNLVHSMPHRCTAVLGVRGDHTYY